MSTSSSTSSLEGTGNYTQPVRGLQNRAQLEKLLNGFFEEQNIKNLMTEIKGTFTTAYSLSDEGFRVVNVMQGDGEPTKFEILYRPGQSHNTKCPNHFVDKALEIALRKVGYEVKVGRADEKSPHTRSMTVTINDYILNAIKNGEQNQVLNDTLRRYITENQGLKNVLHGKQEANNNLITILDNFKEVETSNKLLLLATRKAEEENKRLKAQLQKNSAQNQDVKNQLEKNLTQLKTSLQTITTEKKTTEHNLKKIVAQNQRLTSELASKQNEYLKDKKKLQETNTKLHTQNQSLNQLMKNRTEHQTRKQSLERDLEKKVAQNQQLKSALASTQTEKETLQKHLAELQKVKDQNHTLKHKIAQAQKQNKTLNTLYVSSLPLQKKNMELTDENTNLKNQHQELKEYFLKTVRELNQEVNSAIKNSKTAPSAY